MELEQAVAQLVRDALHSDYLFDGEVFLTNPGADFRQVNGEAHAVERILGNRQ